MLRASVSSPDRDRLDLAMHAIRDVRTVPALAGARLDRAA